MLLFILFLLFCISVKSHRAPDKAPDLPDGWCDLRYGKPTTTTGECICLTGQCEGNGCQNEQGFVWYEYMKCSTCKCMPRLKKEKMTTELKEKKEQEKANKIKEYERIRKENKENSLNDLNNFNFVVEEEKQSFLDIIEENSRLIFVIAICIIIFILLVYPMMYMYSQDNNNNNNSNNNNNNNSNNNNNNNSSNNNNEDKINKDNKEIVDNKKID